MATNRETIEIALSGLEKLNQLERTLKGLASYADDVANAIGGVQSRIDELSGVAGRAATRARTASSAARAVAGVVGDKAFGRGPSGGETLKNRNRLKKIAASLDLELQQSRVVFREATKARRALTPELEKLGKAANQNAREQARIGAELTEYRKTVRSARERILAGASELGAQARGRSTNILRSRYRTQRNRLSSGPELSGELAKQAEELERKFESTEKRLAQLDRAERALNRTVRAANPEASSSELRRIIGRERGAIASSRRATVTEQGRLLEQRREIGRVSRGRRLVGAQSTILRERIGELQRAGVTPGKLKAEIGGQNVDLETIIKQASQAANLAGKKGDIRGNVERAKTLLEIAKNQVGILERELKLKAKIETEDKKRAKAAADLAKASEQAAILEERAANRAAGLYDDSDLASFLQGMQKREQFAKNFLSQLNDTFKLEDQRAKADEKGLTRAQQLAKLEKASAVAAEQFAIAEEKAANFASGLYDDSDLSSFLQGMYKREEFAKNYLSQLEDTFKLEDKRRKANEKGASKTEQQLDRENSQMLAIEKRQRKLAELQAAGVTGPAIQTAQSLVEKLPGLAAQGAGGAREFRRIEKQAAQALAFATPRRGAGAGGARAKTPEQIARNFNRELSSAQVAEQNLISLSRKNVDTSSQLISIQDAINQAKKLGTNISEKDLEILKDQVATARDFVKVENARLANAQKGSNLKALKAASEGRLPSLERDSLTSGLIELGRADTAAKVFRGGRTGEQALSDAIRALNAATGPQKRGPRPGPAEGERRAPLTRKGIPIGTGAAAEAGEAGQNVVDTFANKLSAGAGRILAAGIELGTASAKGIRKALKMNSPSIVIIKIVLDIINSWVNTMDAAIPQVEAVSKKLADASAKAIQGPASTEFGGLPKNAVKTITPKTSSSYIDTAATTLLNLGIDRNKLGNLSDTAMFEMARGIVTQKGAYPLIENIPGIDDRALSNERAIGRAGEQTQIAKKALLDFYGINEKGLPEARAGVTSSTEAAAANVAAAEQEARQLGQAISELVTGFGSLKGLVQAAADMTQGAKVTGAAKVSPDPAIQAAIEKAAQIDAENAAKARERAAIAAEFAPSIQAAQAVDKTASSKAIRDSFTQAAFAPSIQAAKVADKAASDKAIRDSFAEARAQAEADARAVASLSSTAIEEASSGPIDEGEAEVKSAIQRLFDRLSGAVNRAFGGGGGGGGGGRPPAGPVPPSGSDPGDLNEARIEGARGDAQRLLGLADIANLSSASNKQLQAFNAALAETRDGLRTTDAAFDKINKVLRRTEDTLARRDPEADLLVRRFGRRGGQAVGEGLIGGAFPLLFGQGGGAAAFGGLGGALGGFAGGTLGFGLSLVGTAIGSQVDALAQATQDTGNILRDLVGNFEQIKEAGLLASREQEKLVENLLEAGNKTAAYAVIQDELNGKLGVDGAAKLKGAAAAGDRLNRAMADLGLQMQLFVAGPLTNLLNAIASAVENANKTKIAERQFSGLTPEEKRTAIERLRRENVAAGVAGPKTDIVYQRKTGLVGGSDSFTFADGGFQLGTNIALANLTEGLNAAAIARAFSGLGQPAKPQQLTDSKRRQQEIQRAETNRDLTQRELDLVNKINEPREILKGFTQQATAIRREQEDIDRQSFELRRDYEKQIEDIRLQIADRVAQVEAENRQKELEIIVKQGQVREQQFKNAADALRNNLAGDDLAQDLADAVTTYLGAQLSAENQLQQVRKQYEIEVKNQQIELEKYKVDVARNVAQLNLSTAEKVQEINRSIARRNEDAALNNFAIEKQIAALRIKVANEDLVVAKAREEAEIVATNEALRTQELSPETRTFLEQANTTRQARIAQIDKSVKSFQQEVSKIEQLQPPARLSAIGPVSTSGVSFAGLDQVSAQGSRLQQEVLSLETSLIELGKTGSTEAFAARLQDIFAAPFQALENSLLNARKALGEAGNDFSIASAQISGSYDKLIQNLAARNEFQITPEFLALVAASKAVRLELEGLRPTIQFYSGAFDELASSTLQSKQAIAELLRPAKAYDAVLQDINSRGGLGINAKEEQELLNAAKALDEINTKLQVLNGLKDIAGGWTDSFIQLNKELLKGGDLLESVQRFAEGVADRTLDVILEFTLRPIQENLFKNLTDFLGIEQETNPLLRPIEQTRDTLRQFYEGAKRTFMQNRGQQQIQQPPANGIVPGPNAQSSALMGQFTGVGGPDLPASMVQSRVQQALKLTDEEIAAAVNTAIGEYGGSDPLGRTDVFANILNRSRSGQYPRNLVDVVTQPSQYAPNFGLNRAQVTDPNRYGRQMFERVKAELLNEQLLKRSITDINGRMFFKGVSEYPNMMQGDFLRAEGQNFFHGPGRQPGLNPAIASGLMSELGEVKAPVMQAANDVATLMKQFTEEVRIATAALKEFRSASGESAEAAATSAQVTDKSGEKLSKAASTFQQVVGTGLQAIAGIAMGIGGAQMIGKGGTYNTLMGAASIFGSIGSITGMFGTGGSLSGLFGGGGSALKGITGKRALGGPVYEGGDYLVGEQGPEVIRMGANGTVVPADELYVPGLDDEDSSAPPIGRYARRTANTSENTEMQDGNTIYTGNYGRAIPYQRSESTREIERLERITSNPGELPPIKYETTRVNEYDFVTPEQLEASNMRTAKMARNQTIRELADSMKTRKRLGL